MRQPMTDSEWLAEQLKQELRWQAFINEYRARCEAARNVATQTCPVCNGVGSMTTRPKAFPLFTTGLCVWCAGTGRGMEVLEAM